jgi:branched-chain amino acid transport system permease protein
MTALQIIINGILIGSLWTVLGLGKQLILGTLRFVNFAHANFALIGMYLLYFLWKATQVSPFFLVVPVTIALGLLGLAIERPLIRPLVARGQRAQMIATLALLILIQNILNLWFGADSRSVSSSLTTSGLHLAKGLFVTYSSLVIFGFAMAAFLIVWWVLNHTWFGLRVRATAQRRDSAIYCGVNVRSAYGLAFALTLALAGLVGALYAITTPVNPTSAAPLLVLMFVVPILGGLGSIVGTLLGGFVVGILQGLAVQIFPPQLENAVIYVVFVLFLMARPQGLLGDSGLLRERST